MAKVTSNPKNMGAKMKGEKSRSTSFVNIKTTPKRIDKSKALKNKTSGDGLDDYSLDIMKLD